MTALESALRQIHRDLMAAHAPCALVGGLAVSARTEPRFTRDADLAVAVASDAEAEALVRTLARDAVALISERGFHRGRSLGSALEQVIAAVKPGR